MGRPFVRKLGSPRRTLGCLGARDDGAVAVLAALLAASLAGLLALALDLGRAWTLQTELQQAADAAALAGATQLDGRPGARARAIAAAAGELARNRQSFAADGLGPEVLLDPDPTVDPASGRTNNRDIRFHAGPLPLAGESEAGSDAAARFIEVSLASRQIRFAFAALVGAADATRPRARALAGWGTLSCNTPPLALCNPAEPSGGDPAATFDLYADCPDLGAGSSCIGRGITLRPPGAGPPGPGGWRWLVHEPFEEAAGATVQRTEPEALLAAVAAVTGPAACIGQHPTVLDTSGLGLEDALNLRFDIYPDEAARGDAAYQPAPNTVKGLVLPRDPTTGTPVTTRCRYATLAGVPDPGASDWLPPEAAYDGPGLHADLTANPVETMGYPRDACAYPAARVDETTFGSVLGGVEGCRYAAGGEGGTASGGQIGSGQWDLATYLAVEHPGVTVADLLAEGVDLPNAVAPPIAPDGRISRWEVYNWEKRAAGGYLNLPAAGRPLCYRPGETYGTDYSLPEASAGGLPDRRVLIMTVINCASLPVGVAPAERVRPHGAIALFLTEPLGGFAESGTLYGEIVDPRGLGAGTDPLGVVLLRDRLVLFE